MDVTDATTIAAAPTDAATAASAKAAPDLARIRELLREHKFEAVLAVGEGLRAEIAGHRDALLCVAIAQRYLHRIPAALQTLATLERHHPRFSRIYEERGRCFVEMRQAPQAIEAFLTAVNINHALPGSWSMLEGLYRMTGEAELEEKALRLGRALSGRVARFPGGFTQLLCGLTFALGPSHEVVLAGLPGSEEIRAMIEALNRRFIPEKVVLVRDESGGSGGPDLAELAPFLASYRSDHGAALAYVCANNTCSLPTSKAVEMLRLLGEMDK